MNHSLIQISFVWFFLATTCVYAQDELTETTWGGHSANVEGQVDTGDFLGWIFIKHAPWIWSYTLNRWIYAPDPGPAAPGTWCYLSNPKPWSPPNWSMQTIRFTAGVAGSIDLNDFVSGYPAPEISDTLAGGILPAGINLSGGVLTADGSSVAGTTPGIVFVATSSQGSVNSPMVSIEIVDHSRTTSVTQFGITWTFDRALPFGQFANGDYWVVRDGGSFKITSITPGWDGVRNGTMVNPLPNSAQGFDSRVVWFNYDAGKNIADKLPYTVAQPVSIVSCISMAATQTYQLDTVAVLTVLDDLPPDGAFRPPYAGSNKSIPATASDLDYSRLRSLDSGSLSNVPNMGTVVAKFERPWIDLHNSFYAAHLHPLSNQANYGREICNNTGEAGLMLNLDFSNTEKELLLIRYVQLGIDIYGLARNGHVWMADGGHKQGRKLPLLIAGAVLNNETMLNWADAGSHMIFQEDLQTDYVDQTLINITNSGSWDPDVRNPSYRAYSSSDLGNAEWAIRYHANPEKSDADWGALYRVVNGGPGVATSLVVHVMDLKPQWNWPAFFDYHEDRYWPAERNRVGEGPNAISRFAHSAWLSYGP